MDPKISVVIPNFNGRNILLKNLPAVIKNCPNSQIIVVDDASSDDSVSTVHKKFKKIKVIKLKTNRGFANAANLGIKAAKAKIILLINSDVSPRQGFLNPALRYFTKSKKKIFAVGLCDYSHERNQIIRKGRGGAYFRMGFVYHYPAQIERGLTLWTSGGSSLINREFFLKLGGFDTIFKPFYWEDIDLGFRAYTQGYECHFEPLSGVDHYHEEGAIIKEKSQVFIKTVSYKNQFIFTWKNIHNYFLVFQHIIFLPYHFIKSATNLDYPFFLGFFWAVACLPKLILQYDFNNPERIIRSEREVLKIFEKQ